MSENFRLLPKALFSLMCLLPILASSQNEFFQAEPVEGLRVVGVSDEVSTYDLYRLDLPKLAAFVQSEAYANRIQLALPGYGEFDIDLVHNPLMAESFAISLGTEEGKRTVPYTGEIRTFKGHLKGGQWGVRLTIDDDFVSGLIQLKDDELIIESAAHRDASLPYDIIVVYRKSDITQELNDFCAVQDRLRKSLPGHEHEHDHVHDTHGQRVDGDCFEIEIALANDWLMYEERGENETAVINHNMAVINNLQANFDDEFPDEYDFVVTEIFVSTCESCDPWTASTNASAVLNSFSSWAGTGFDFAHDVATLWTDRDFNGPTIGLAWVDAVCANNFKYNTCQDFTGNANFLRVLQAHELGHNFGSNHDAGGSPTIMAPSINNSAQWSGSSINQIDNYMTGVGCLSACASSLPPLALMSSDVTEGCSPLTIQFEDLSEGSPTSWNWEFPGGTPTTSTEQNPTVTYEDAGTYDVILQVTNAVGDDIVTFDQYVNVFPDAFPDFSFIDDELTVFFTNQSINSDSYLWDFGDGNVSTDTDPVHTYAEDGVYDVTLTATNQCGDVTVVISLEVISTPVADFTFSPGEGCEPLTVTYENLSTENANAFLWEFEGGEPSSSTEANPIVTYEQAGVYGVTFTASNSAGEDLLVLQDLIIVEPQPTADFQASVIGVTADFENLSSDAYAYSWDFGDGNTSNEFSPSHAYSEGGEYTVTLISENDCGADTTTIQVSVASAPVGIILASTSEGCAPFEVQYSNVGTGDVESYSWTFPGGSPSSSTLAEPLVTYNTPGTYSATLIVTNEIGGDTTTLQNVVTINPDVVADLSFVINGQEVSFFNESSGEEDVIWDIDGVIYPVDNPVVDFGQDGTYDILLTADGECGVDTFFTTVTIATPPSADFTVGTATGCEPFEVQFTDASSGNTTAWAWSFPGGEPASSNDPNPLVTYAEPGQYGVSLTVTSAGGEDQIVLDDIITVDPLPLASFSTIENLTEVQLSNQSEDATDYFWDFGDGTTSTDIAPTHDYSEFGEYQIMLIASNNCGSDTAIIELQVAGLPVPDFNVQQAQATGCAPFEVAFEDASQNMPETWEWIFPGGDPASSTEASPIVTYSTPGVYDVTLKVSNLAGAQSVVKEQFVVVNDVPLADFEAEVNGDLVVFENTSQDADSYEWIFGDGTTSDAVAPEHTYLENGDYTVLLISSNACGSDTSEITLTIETTSVMAPGQSEAYEIWPNPSRGRFNLKLNGHSGEEVLITVFDPSGRQVYRTWLSAPQQHTIDLENTATPGMYYIRIGDHVEKVVVSSN